jgi:hypothetical protein
MSDEITHGHYDVSGPTEKYFDKGAEPDVGMNAIARELLDNMRIADSVPDNTPRHWKRRAKKVKPKPPVAGSAHALFVEMLKGYLVYLEGRGSWTSVTTSEGKDEVTIVVRMDKAGK